MKRLPICQLAVLLAITLVGSSCVPLAFGAAGVAAGYAAHDDGYRVRNPITKTESYDEE